MTPRVKTLSLTPTKHDSVSGKVPESVGSGRNTSVSQRGRGVAESAIDDRYHTVPKIDRLLHGGRPPPQRHPTVGVERQRQTG